MSSPTVRNSQLLSEQTTNAVGNATISAEFAAKSGGDRPPSAQDGAKKISHSRWQAGSRAYEANDLDEVTFLRLPDVKAITGLSKTSLYALIREKSFPPPVRLGVRTVAWVKSEVRQWAVDRVHASRSVA